MPVVCRDETREGIFLQKNEQATGTPVAVRQRPVPEPPRRIPVIAYRQWPETGGKRENILYFITTIDSIQFFMKKIGNFILALSTTALLLSCGNRGKNVQSAHYDVIPLPNEITTAEGNPFILSSATKIVFPEGNDKMKRNAELLSEFLGLSAGIKPAITAATSGKNAIILQLGLESDNREAYSLTVTENTITISGVTEAGVFYGIQTLRKSVPVNARTVSFAPVAIHDAPRFGYRGAMLDVARHFQPVEFVKKYIDLLALHNMNTFHWHLTEDQGWRIEIKKYPELTRIGSQRTETVIGRNSDKYDGTPHGGFYTQQEIKDIVQYAADRHITVVPEIDLPGHMLAALASYPQLGCTGGPYEVEKKWGVFDDILCAGKEETFTFLEGVLAEVMELFPSKLIHIGGDEAPKVRWEKCPACQARIKELGIKAKNGFQAEHYLQSYVTARIEKFLNDNGRSIIGWDEILEGELAPNATVMSWRGMEGGIKAAQMGHDVIMTPTQYAYFDYYQTADNESEPLAIGGFLPLERVYGFEPAPDILTEEQKAHIIGTQANLWTEYIKTPEHAEYMALPRLDAISEVQWTQPAKKNYDNFLQRLPAMLKLYDKLGYNYAGHVFDIDAETAPNLETNSLDVELATIDNADIHYTLDGSQPTPSSDKYEGKFSVKENVEIKAAAFRDGKPGKIYTQKVHTAKSSYKPIELLTPTAPQYTYAGAEILIDGLLGNSVNYRTGKWLGYQGQNMVAVIDMLQPTPISSAEIHTCVVTGDWIFDASEFTVESSDDNATYTAVAGEKIDNTKTEHWSDIVTHTLTFAPKTARYFKITLKPSIIPEWHPEKGKPAFLFVDEIALN